jgi:hypothetical protein
VRRHQLHQSYWICIFSGSQFLLAQLPNLAAITAVSFAAAAMSLSYSTVSWAACLARGPVGGVSYAYQTGTPADSAFHVFSALGQVAFAYAGHGVVLEIQATVPSTPTKPSKVPMWRGTVATYVVTAMCYFPVAFARSGRSGATSAKTSSCRYSSPPGSSPRPT